MALRISLLTGSHGRDGLQVGRRSLRCGVHTVDRALTDGYLGSSRAQVDVERRSNCPDPTIARMDPERPLRVVGYFEKSLTALQVHHASPLAVAHLDPAVGIEVEG